ncbi:MAG: BamA/TamA family outer membrane protein, partial [Deltaproteobacteria bacterium]|nr:BamA/TamA family outer membrane protein [Deltaproteobacteria bacterium]
MLDRWTAVMLFVAATTMACRTGPVHKPGDEWLAAIEFEGNTVLSDRTLRTGLVLDRAQKRGQAPDPYQIQLDLERVRGEYLRRGFLDVGVRSRTDRKGDATTVTYVIEEGPRAATRVAIAGVPEELIDEVRAILPIADGAPFDYAKYDAAKQPLLDVVREAGYARAKLETVVVADRVNRQAIVQLTYELGPKARFGPVEVTGVSGRLAQAVRERIQVDEGRPYSTSAITETRYALYAMRRFSTVRVETAKQIDSADDAVVPISISVSESARREIKLGGGFGLDPASYEVRARIGYSITGWPSPLDTVTIDLRPAYALLRDGTTYVPRIRALAKLERMDLFTTYLKGSIEGGYNYVPIEAYTSYGPLARLGLSRPLFGPRVQVRAGWKIERYEFRDLNPLVDEMTAMRLGLDRAQRNAAFQQAFVIDLRDDLIEPQLGLYAEARVAEGTRYAGSQYNYVQFTPELRGYAPLGPVVVAARVRGGTFYGAVPTTERYFGGGASSQRGFPERR